MSTSPICALPVELLAQCLILLDAPDLLTLLSVSSGLRSFVSQDVLWEPHCERIYNKGSAEILGWRKIQKTDILPSGHVNHPYYIVWRRLHLYEDYLGYWLSLEDSPTGFIMSITLRREKLVVSQIIPSHSPPFFGTSRTHIFLSTWYNDSITPLSIDSDSTTLSRRLRLPVDWFLKGPHYIADFNCVPQTFEAREIVPPVTEDERSEEEPPLYEWLKHRSPSLFATIRHSGISVDDEGYVAALAVPTLTLPKRLGGETMIGLQSPFQPSPTGSPIADGFWLASYGHSHGYEFIYIHIRKITEADLSSFWGTEGNILDSFNPELRNIRELLNREEISHSDLSEEDARVGDSILEAIKVTGDINVPRGVRTFIGFPNHRTSWSGAREAGDFVARPESHPWPIHPQSAIENRIPTKALPAALSDMRAEDVPARGMTLPGLMRVADTGFTDPKWANATIHIASRKEIRVMLQDGCHVMTFHKIEKNLLQGIR